MTTPSPLPVVYHSLRLHKRWEHSVRLPVLFLLALINGLLLTLFVLGILGVVMWGGAVRIFVTLMLGGMAAGVSAILFRLAHQNRRSQ